MTKILGGKIMKKQTANARGSTRMEKGKRWTQRGAENLDRMNRIYMMGSRRAGREEGFVFPTLFFELRSSGILKPRVQTRGDQSDDKFESRSDGIPELIQSSESLRF